MAVPVVLVEQHLERGARAPVYERFAWLRERLREDRIGVCVWVSSPLWASFALPMRLAPVQVFWALRFHPLAVPGMDGRITYGSPRERERILDGHAWRVCPVPLGMDATPPDAQAVAALKRELPPGFLLGTLARPEKIASPPFLECVTRILQAHPQARYLWAGRDEHAGIAEFFRSRGVADRCHFVGWVDTRLYAAALDLFLESFPLGTGVVPYQALGAGTPLLSYFAPTTVFGVSFWHEFPDEVPRDLERYPLACASSPDDYVRLANELIADSSRRARVAARGKQFFIEQLADSPDCAKRFAETIAAFAAERLPGSRGVVE
jgi:predicted O-linked N-acetylglucosamine transferase (SPINDLY family)